MQSLKKLKWQCRRGTQELDTLLMGYLERNYVDAHFDEQQHFQQLLDLPDNELLQLFFMKIDSDRRDLNYLIEKIRHSTSIYNP